MIIIKKVRYVAALIIMAASMSVLLCSCIDNNAVTEQTSSVITSITTLQQSNNETTGNMPSSSETVSTQNDIDLIGQFMHDSNRYKKYQLPDQFQMEEPNVLFRKYGSRYYRCTWLDAIDNGAAMNLTAEFLIKNGEIFLINQFNQLFEVLEVDFDHDGTTELIIHNQFGSGISTDTYYVIEKGDEPIYHIAYWYAWFEKIQNSDYIIRVRTNDGREVFGVLKYRVVDDIKTVYIDAGEDTDKLRFINQKSD